MLSSLVIYIIYNSADCWYLANFLVYGWPLSMRNVIPFLLTQSLPGVCKNIDVNNLSFKVASEKETV